MKCQAVQVLDKIALVMETVMLLPESVHATKVGQGWDAKWLTALVHLIVSTEAFAMPHLIHLSVRIVSVAGWELPVIILVSMEFSCQ